MEFLTITEYSEFDQTFMVKRTNEECESAIYRVEFDVTELKDASDAGDDDIVIDRGDGFFAFVGIPDEMIRDIGYDDLSPDDFQGLHEAIAHRVNEVWSLMNK